MSTVVAHEADSTGVVTRLPLAPFSPVSKSTAIINMIERVSHDPAASVEVVRQLLDMLSQIQAKEDEAAFWTAMTEVQSEMRRIAPDSHNPQTRSKYASYAALDRVLRPIYTKHGFVLSFNTSSEAPEGFLRVLCYVAKGGYVRHPPYQIDIPSDGKGAKGGDVMTRTHATGSASSYGMRYLLKMIFNVAIGENDDDGNGAGNGTKHNGDTHNATITPEQVATISQLAGEVRADIPKFLTYMRVPSIPDMPANQYQRAIDALKALPGWRQAAALKRQAQRS